jgi:hypothetical protein
MRPSRSGPADCNAGLESVHGKPADQATLNPQTCFTAMTFATQGNQGSRKTRREDHYTPEKLRMECVGKTRCARYRRLLKSCLFRFLELAKGFEPPTP